MFQAQTTMTFSFQCTVEIPSECFQLWDRYIESPQKFVEAWLSGSITNLCDCPDKDRQPIVKVAIQKP